MEKQLSEQEFLASFENALRNDYIYACFQPQINHSTGRMVGAEALVRWRDPKYGVQYPSSFIPILERYDLIYQVDLHMFKLVCRLQRKCLDNKFPMVPISINMSRYDIYRHEYVKAIEEIRKEYDIPVKYLRIEITETSAIGGMELMSSTINQLHACGYIVEMDDFGSGYSSLNILKDLNVDIIKLDMNFLSGEVGGRGGIILSSVVQMAKWLDTPLIAEGVETMEQADYMKSLGCNYIQGYLYSKPVPEEDFLVQLKKLRHEVSSSATKFVNAVDAGEFWSPDSMDTLLFNHFVGAAAIFIYREGEAEILRVNEKYIEELGMNLTEQDLVGANPWDRHDENGRAVYEETIKRAIASGKEESCETWRDFHSKCCGDESICIRSHIRVIGHAGKQYLIYAMIRNITAERKDYVSLRDSDKIFRFAIEQANMYAWEYTVATRQMRPCFRCMRDMKLPPILENYPEPVIRMGIIPPDYADMYRDWHRRIEAGEPHLEAIVPMTVGRIPFHLRYTTEFDENGRPVKAYGSATMVVKEEAPVEAVKEYGSVS